MATRPSIVDCCFLLSLSISSDRSCCATPRLIRFSALYHTLWAMPHLVYSVKRYIVWGVVLYEELCCLMNCATCHLPSTVLCHTPSIVPSIMHCVTPCLVVQDNVPHIIHCCVFSTALHTYMSIVLSFTSSNMLSLGVGIKGEGNLITITDGWYELGCRTPQSMAWIRCINNPWCHCNATKLNVRSLPP